MSINITDKPEMNVVNVGDVLTQDQVNAINGNVIATAGNPFVTQTETIINFVDGFVSYQSGVSEGSIFYSSQSSLNDPIVPPWGSFSTEYTEGLGSQIQIGRNIASGGSEVGIVLKNSSGSNIVLEAGQALIQNLSSGLSDVLWINSSYIVKGDNASGLKIGNFSAYSPNSHSSYWFYSNADFGVNFSSSIINDGVGNPYASTYTVEAGQVVLSAVLNDGSQSDLPCRQVVALNGEPAIAGGYQYGIRFVSDAGTGGVQDFAPHGRTYNNLVSDFTVLDSSEAPPSTGDKNIRVCINGQEYFILASTNP